MSQRPGNHGTFIPRDKTLLHRLYWKDGHTLPSIAEMFDVTHKSVLRVFHILEIPTRSKGSRPDRRLCKACFLRPPKKLRHKLTKNGTGTLCAECLSEYKRDWQRTNTRRHPEVRAKRRAEMERWYQFGAINPKGESQWITKSKHLLRTTRRLLKGMTPPALSQSQSVASAPGQTSQT